MLLVSWFDLGSKQMEKKLSVDYESGVLTSRINRTAENFADKNYCAENLLNDRRVVFYKQLGNNSLRLPLKP